MSKIIKFCLFSLFLLPLLTNAVYPGSANKWVTLPSDAPEEVKKVVRKVIDKIKGYSTSREESANLKAVGNEKRSREESYDRAISELTAAFRKRQNKRDDLARRLQICSMELENLEKDIQNLESSISNSGRQIERYKEEVEIQKATYSEWLKTEKQGEAVAAVIYTKGLRDQAHALRNQADRISVPLLTEYMDVYMQSRTTTINSVSDEHFIRSSHEGTARWNGEVPITVKLADGSSGKTYLRIKRYELFPFLESKKKVEKWAGRKIMKAALIRTSEDLRTFLSDNGFARHSLPAGVEEIIRKAVAADNRAEESLNEDTASYREKIDTLIKKINKAEEERKAQRTSLPGKKKSLADKKTEKEQVHKEKEESEQSFEKTRSDLAGKKSVRDFIFIKESFGVPKGEQSDADVVVETIQDKLIEVKNDARTLHSRYMAAVSNGALEDEKKIMTMTEAKIKGFKLISITSEGDGVKVRIAFRVKTVLTPKGFIRKREEGRKVSNKVHSDRSGIVEGMVPIPEGCFQMGAADGDGQEDEKPAHEVCVSAFYLGEHEVTNTKFKEFMDDNPEYKTTAEKEGSGWGISKSEADDWGWHKGLNWKRPLYLSDDIRNKMDHPVIQISYFDAMAYADWLSRKTGRNYRLPTEAEWEYAARGGKIGYKYSWGNEEPRGQRQKGGNIADESLKNVYKDWPIWNGYTDEHVYTAPVGSFEANTFGLSDMTGNVWEWCLDIYDGEAYKKPNVSIKNPVYIGNFKSIYSGNLSDILVRLKNSGSDRVIRGGSWSSRPRDVRAANRYFYTPSNRFYDVGFRLALGASGQD